MRLTDAKKLEPGDRVTLPHQPFKIDEAEVVTTKHHSDPRVKLLVRVRWDGNEDEFNYKFIQRL